MNFKQILSVTVIIIASFIFSFLSNEATYRWGWGKGLVSGIIVAGIVVWAFLQEIGFKKGLVIILTFFLTILIIIPGIIKIGVHIWGRDTVGGFMAASIIGVILLIFHALTSRPRIFRVGHSGICGVCHLPSEKQNKGDVFCPNCGAKFKVNEGWFLKQ